MLFIIVLLLYLLLTTAVCVVGRTGRSSSFQDFLTAKNSTGFWVMAGSAAAMHIGSGFVIGGAESGALYGISGAWYGLGCALSTILVGFTVIRFARRHGYVTLSDYFKSRYGDNRTTIIYSIATPVSYIAVMSAQILAGKAIFQAFGVEGDWGAWITAAVVLVYSMLFGLRGTYLASAIHVCVITAGLLVVTVVLFRNGEMQHAWEVLPERYGSFTALGPSDTVMYVVPTLLAGLVGQVNFQRAVSARSELAAVGGHGAAGLLLIPLALAPALIGVYGAAYYPQVPAAALFFRVVLGKTPALFAALLVAALASVIMATCSSGFLGISATLVHDIYQGILNPEATDAQCTSLSRLISVLSCVLAVGLALVFQNIVEILSISYTLISSCCLIPLLGGLAWRRGNSRGVLWSAAAGGVTTLLTSTGLLSVPFGSIVPLVPALIGYWAGSLSGSRQKTNIID